MTTALQFSGGKDSLACLHLYRSTWNTLHVVWVNTGAAYPEVVEYMEGWKKILPHFHEIKSDQPAQIEAHGWPSDVVPLRYTSMARIGGMDSPYLIQPWTICCAENIWFPMHRAMRELGVTQIIRGQRNDEGRKGKVRNGEVVEGVEYVYPLENWTREQVFAYLAEVGAEVPAYYRDEETSHDCWDCTAYLDENQRRIANLPADRRALVMDRLQLIADAVKKEMNWNPAYA